MLPFSDRLVYEQLQQAIAQLQAIHQQAAIAPTELKTKLATLQQQWQRCTAHTPLAEMPSRVQAIAVEIDKQLRLLAIDALFLQTARQSATVEQRRHQISDRLTLLQRYCDALLTER